MNDQKRKRGKQDESFVSVGTEQPTDVQDVKAKDRNNYLPVWQQEARDEKGKKRLHGAFTGGFSAGYYNTVGSKEGWQPSTFTPKSQQSTTSRSNQKPEDFMDEEDQDEFFGQNRVTLQEDYDVFGGTEREVKRRREMQQKEHSIGGALIDSMIVPKKDTVGVKLMRVMGWREDQGIGPRSKRKNKDDPHAAAYLFAPREVVVDIVVSKRNNYGLGYDPTRHAPEFQQHGQGKDFLFKEDEAIKKRAVGFGVGVFEDEDDDIYYDGDERDGYSKTLMDEGEEYPEVKKKIEAKKSKSAPRQAKVGFDGKQALVGFVFGVNVLVAPLKFIQIALPRDWKLRVPFPQSIQPPSTNKSFNKKLTVDERRSILGEQQLLGPPQSLKQTISSAPSLPQDFSFEALPTVSKQLSLLAIEGFTPFGEDEQKQLRYKRFLQVKAELEKDFIQPPMHMPEQARFHELMEFSKAAMIYRPLSQSMASRFTSSSETKKDTKQDSEKAAEVSMYGALTRQEVQWIPTNLLCKRLNIRNPYPSKLDPSDPDYEDPLEKQVLNKRVMGQLLMDMRGEDGKEELTEDAAEKNELLEMQIVYGEEKVSVNDESVKSEVVYVRPSVALFKSIFVDSDSEDDEVDAMPMDIKLEVANLTSEVRDVAMSEEREEVSEDDTTFDIPLPEPVAVAAVVLEVIAVDEDPQQATPFRPVFTKKEDRNSKSSARATPITLPSTTKNIGRSMLSFDMDDDEAEEDEIVINRKKKASQRPTASDYM